MSEDAPTNPISPYGVTKLAAEHLCRLYHANFGIPAVILRYFTVYGARQRPDMAFHRFIRAALDGEPVVVYEDGLQTRDFTHVRDVVQATVLAAQATNGSGKIFNVAGGSQVPLNDAIELIGEVVGTSMRTVPQPGKAGDVRHTYADTSRARAELGYQPLIDLREGLRDEVVTGIPFSVSTHAKDLYTASPSSISFFAKQSHFIATCTDFNVRFLRSLLPPDQADKIQRVYHGVDTTRFQPPPARPDNPVPRIVSVGRLVPKKGYEHVVEAASALRAMGMPFLLEIYGDGPLRALLQLRIDQAGLGNDVRLLGARRQDELILAYQGANLFLLAPVTMPDGDRDGIPNVLLEAMATGLPVVSTPTSGIPEVVEHGKNGLLVPPGDPATLASALRELLDSATLRRRLGTAARATVVERFDATQNADALAALFGIGKEVYAHRVPGA